MNDSKKLLTAMLGDRGYEVLEKAIYKQRTQAVIDPLEYYLPLIVVPRTIISWLIQTIKPMKVGEIKDVKFPGRDDIAIHFDKQDIDQYRAEFVQAGRVIHAFEKQSLPAASGHMMTVGELYDDFADGKKPEVVKVYDHEKATQMSEEKHEGPRPEFGALQHMISMANVSTPHDPESIKWEMSHANIRELTGVIGKLVDSLTAKQMSSKRLEDELDKVSEKEVKGDAQKRENSQTPEEKNKKDIAATASNPAIKTKQEGIIEIRDNKAKATSENTKGPEPKVVKDGTEAASGDIKKESMKEGQSSTIHAASMNASKNVSSPRMAGAQNDQDKQRNVEQRMAPMNTAKGYFRKKAEILTKPYVSDAQRRWAHTDAGTKALGGEGHVHEWDESSKGKKLPEHVKKEELGKDQKGVHAAWPYKSPQGHSKMGYENKEAVRTGAQNSNRSLVDKLKDVPANLQGLSTPHNMHKLHNQNAKAHAQRVLSEQRAMPKPNLPKSEDKQVGKESVATGTGGMANIKHPKGGGFDIPLLAAEKSPSQYAKDHDASWDHGQKGTYDMARRQVGANHAEATAAVGRYTAKFLAPKKMDKAEMPKGAGQPKGPQPPQAPKPPVPAGNAPAASAAKQAQTSGTGGYKPPQTPGAQKPVNSTKTPINKSDYFRGKLDKCMGKSIRATATEEQLYKSACPECGKAEFIKAADGVPEFNPCACFRVLKKDEEGRAVKFVTAIHKADGNYGLEFDQNADPEVVKMFLLTLKARLLIKKNHGI